MTAPPTAPPRLQFGDLVVAAPQWNVGVVLRDVGLPDPETDRRNADVYFPWRDASDGPPGAPGWGTGGLPARRGVVVGAHRGAFRATGSRAAGPTLEEAAGVLDALLDVDRVGEDWATPTEARRMRAVWAALLRLQAAGRATVSAPATVRELREGAARAPAIALPQHPGALWAAVEDLAVDGLAVCRSFGPPVPSLVAAAPGPADDDRLEPGAWTRAAALARRHPVAAPPSV